MIKETALDKIFTWIVRLASLLVIVLTAILIPWTTWVTNETIVNREFRTAGERFTEADAKQMRLDYEKQLHTLQLTIEGKIATLPPPDWRAKIEAMNAKLEIVSTNQIRIMAILEELRSQNNNSGWERSE